MSRGKTTKDEDGFSIISYRGKKKKHPREGTRAFSFHTPISLASDNSPESLQNFSEVIKDVQDELKHSDFVARFEEDFQNVLDEWGLGLLIPAKDSTTPTNSPNHSDAVIQKLKHVDIVCYGLGPFSFCTIARYQLGFLLVLRHILGSDRVHIYDPQFSAEEVTILKELGLDVLDVNEEAKRTSTCKTIFFMPHCDQPLYNNLLWANWSVERLPELVIIGNSFQSYEFNDARRHLKDRAKYIYLANKFATEIRMANVFRFQDIFNDLSIHYFKSSSVSLIDAFVWTDLEEPEYNEEDERCIKGV